jgi:hypothetical protein
MNESELRERAGRVYWKSISNNWPWDDLSDTKKQWCIDAAWPLVQLGRAAGLRGSAGEAQLFVDGIVGDGPKSTDARNIARIIHDRCESLAKEVDQLRVDGCDEPQAGSLGLSLDEALRTYKPEVIARIRHETIEECIDIICCHICLGNPDCETCEKKPQCEDIGTMIEKLRARSQPSNEPEQDSPEFKSITQQEFEARGCARVNRNRK